MTKSTLLALATATILGAGMISAGAQAQTQAPRPTTLQQERGHHMMLSRGQTRLTRERRELVRDMRMGRTTEAARLRREINADERAITRAKSGMRTNPTVRPMQPGPTGTQPSQTGTQQNQSTTPEQGNYK